MSRQHILDQASIVVVEEVTPFYLAVKCIVQSQSQTEPNKQKQTVTAKMRSSSIASFNQFVPGSFMYLIDFVARTMQDLQNIVH